MFPSQKKLWFQETGSKNKRSFYRVLIERSEANNFASTAVFSLEYDLHLCHKGQIMSEQVVRALDAYLVSIESQANRLRTIASRLENEEQQTEIREIDANLREATLAMRNQIRIIVDWAWKD
jgi:hypothetical protein